MFDELLDRLGFERRLKELGYPDDEVVKQWKIYEDEFYRQCLVAIYEGLTEEEKKKLPGNGDFGMAIDGVGEYVRKNASRLDGRGIMKTAATRAQENYLRLLVDTGEA